MCGRAEGRHAFRSRALPIDCSGFASITRCDGTTGPWRAQITRTELGAEMRMVRAACYIFVAALSMMRDSEIQEIGRDAIVSHYGSPAIDWAQPEPTFMRTLEDEPG